MPAPGSKPDKAKIAFFAGNYETLDAIAVFGALMIVAGIVYGLFAMPNIPSDRLPIISALATAVLGLPISYGAFRWGNNVGAKAATEAAAENSKVTSAAVAQLAGAGPQPPAQPLSSEPLK